MNKFSSLQIEYLQSRNLHDFFENFSHYVWERLKFHAENPMLSTLRETTLNENLFDGLIALMDKPLNLRLFHAKEERVNGNDFEIFVEISPNDFIYFPGQVKKIYLNGEYEAISHPVGKYDKREQILNLIDYAKGKGLPIYSFFNYSKDDFNFSDNNYVKELFGCTVIDAFYIKEKYFDANKNKIKPVYFKNIHPPANPFIAILDLINSRFPNSLKRVFPTIENLPVIKHYTKEQLVTNGLWIEINPSKDEKSGMFVGTSQLEELCNAEHKIYNSDFLPRYRLLLTIDDIQERKLNYSKKINIIQNEQPNFSRN